jgi:hypothetical protein
MVKKRTLPQCKIHGSDDGFDENIWAALSMTMEAKMTPKNSVDGTANGKQWFWYNSICHSLDPNHSQYPHMPPHAGEPWPKQWTKDGYKMNEIDVCYDLF